MKTILTLSLSISLALGTQAQLAPLTEAPLYRHMLEVNAQWKAMDPALANDASPVHFNNEAERIAQHLHLVVNHLRSHAPKGLSTEAAAQRSTLLNALERYAHRGLFPQNQVLPYRNPVFIDPYGTACAVGQLMIESGRRDLAEDINKEMNLAYVHDMKRADVLQWATEKGFSEDELAWIQPGYPPSIDWWGLDGGTNGTVKVLLQNQMGPVVLAGEFSQAGGVAAQNVALWSPGSFTALGGGVSGTITCGALMGNDIYLGGSGIGGNNDLAHWNGTQWSFTTVFDGKLPQIFALHVINDTLYAAGESQGFVGVDDFVKRLSGSTWVNLPGMFNARVLCLGDFNGKLVAGGAFTALSGGSGTSLGHVAIHEPGGWVQLADGLDGAVNVLRNANGKLYAAGAMFANVAPLYGLAHIATGAAAWTHALPNLANYVSSTLGDAEVRSLLDDGNGVWVGGSFSIIQGTLVGQHLAYFNGTPDGLTPMASFNNPVNALAMDYFVSDIYGVIAGGEFTQDQGNPAPYLAEAYIGSGIHDMPDAGGFTLYPNPAMDQVTITMQQAAGGKPVLDVFDAQGRLVQSKPVTGLTTTFHVASLPAGAYSIRLTSTHGSRTRPFIKQ